MIDSLTSSISTILNAKRDSAFQKDVKDNITEIKELAHKVVEALNETLAFFDKSDDSDEDFQENTLSRLTDIYSAILQNNSNNAGTEENSLLSLSREITSSIVSAGSNQDENTAIFKAMDKSLYALVKLNHMQLQQEMRMGRIVNKIEKVVGKDANKTKMTESSSGGGEDYNVGPLTLDPSKLDMSGIAKSMASSAAAALNPAKLVKAFFTELLPYVIIFGLLLYGFITGYLGGDVYDFILVLGGIIVAAFLAYIAYQYVKAAILLAFQITCELIKVALAAQPALLAMVAIGIIMVAFLLVAGVMLILFGAAFILIAKGVSILIESITDSIIKFLSFGVETFAKIPVMIGEMFGKIIRAIFGGKSDDEEKKESSLFSLFHTSIIPKMDDIIDAIRMNKLPPESVSELTDESKNINIDLEDGALLSYLNELTTDTHSIAGLVSDILSNNAEKESEIIKQVASSIIEQNTKAVMNSYQITDGTTVLKDTTAYATSESESAGGTDISQVIAQLGKIVSHLSDIYETEKKIAAGNDKSIWAGLGIS